MTKSSLPESLDRLTQDHIEMRTALNMLEGEIESVAQYNAPNADLIGSAVQYFANFPARCHHPIEDLIFHVIKTRAPGAVRDLRTLKQHLALTERVGDLAMMARNLFIDTPKWRVPFCTTARSYILLKREHIREEETAMFRLALEYLTPADWFAVNHAASAANAQWNDDPASAGAIEALGLKTSRAMRASASAHRA